MKREPSLNGIVSFALLTLVFSAGFTVLAVRLRVEQVDKAAQHRSEMETQSFRRVQTAGLRGGIFDRHGTPLAVNRLSLCITVDPGA